MSQTLTAQPGPVTSPQAAMPARVAPVGANRAQFLWLCALILSFCYELPIYYLTSMDRLNPRLFDLVAVAGVYILLFQNRGLRSPWRNPIFKWWFWLVIWFSVCAAIYAAAWFPWDAAGKYSAYYAIKYLEGLFCTFLAASIPLTTRQKNTVHWLIAMGGIVVGLYAVYELFLGSSVRFIAEGKEVRRADGWIFSCLGPTYFHIASFSTAATAMCLALANKYPPSQTKLFLYGAAVCAAWPTFFCGSRTGLAMMMLVLASGFVMMKRTRFTLTASIVLGIVSVLLLMSPGEFVEKAARSSATIRRLVGFETNRGGANSVSARVGLGLDSVTIFTSGSYSWQGARLPVFGGGFYAVPHSNGPRIAKYRIGYGIHNAFLFPFEQGGIPAFVLFLIFVSVTIKYCWRATRFPNETDKQFAVGVICVGAAFLPCMWVGQIFWRGFGTENFNTMLVVLFVLAIQPAVDSVKTVSMPQVRTIPGRHPVPS